MPFVMVNDRPSFHPVARFLCVTAPNKNVGPMTVANHPHFSCPAPMAAILESSVSPMMLTTMIANGTYWDVLPNHLNAERTVKHVERWALLHAAMTSIVNALSERHSSVVNEHVMSMNVPILRTIVGLPALARIYQKSPADAPSLDAYARTVRAKM